MRILLLGGGGREHALAWNFLANGHEVVAAPGNPGIARSGALCVPLAITDPCAVVACAKAHRVDLVVIGPEAPLVAGVADALRAAGLVAFGPGERGAQLEASKAFSKRFFAAHGLPTAPHLVCERMDQVQAALDALGARVVVKADGLAAGKGVVVCDDASQAMAAAREMLEGRFGAAGQTVVIETRLEGREVSLLAVTDGEALCVLPATEDHKAVLDGDRGPNTGGMGTVSPAWVGDEIVRRAIREVFEPTLVGLRREGIDYRGVLFAGLMVAPDGTPNLLEYNCRFGDPETQAIMMRWQGDAARALHAAASGRLADYLAAHPVAWTEATAVCVVLAAPGYPDAPSMGMPIHGDVVGTATARVFHAGTSQHGEQLTVAGGRVFGVTALGADVESAREAAYAAAARIEFEGKHCRRDIGLRRGIA